MKIDYKSFNKYSEKTKERISLFARTLLSIMEIYGNDKNIPLSDFDREGFSFEEGHSMVLKLNELLENTLIHFEYRQHWEGPMSNRTYKSFIYLNFENGVPEKVSKFLKKFPVTVPKSISEVVSVGDLEYKNKSIFWGGSRLEKMTPQTVELCRYFINNPDTFVSDNTIKEISLTKKPLNTATMQKLVSSVRRSFKTKKINVSIDRTGDGYMFNTQKIR